MTSIATNEPDFLERLVDDVLNKQDYYALVVSPMLVDGNSIAVMPMPANDYDYYYDGSHRQGYNFQVLARHEEQLTTYNTLLIISALLTKIQDIPSKNGSYKFENESITITTDVSIIGKDDRYFTFAAQFSADLLINPKG